MYGMICCEEKRMWALLRESHLSLLDILSDAEILSARVQTRRELQLHVALLHSMALRQPELQIRQLACRLLN